MVKSIQSIPVQGPGDYLPEFEKIFEKYWLEKTTGVKAKRQKIAFDASESESEGYNSDASIDVKKSQKHRRTTMTNRRSRQYVISKEEALQQHEQGYYKVAQEKQERLAKAL